jgi:hypothetical protein
LNDAGDTVMDHALSSSPLATTDGARTPVWIGRVLTGLIVAFMLFDASGKLVPLDVVIESTQKVGFGVELVRPLGVVLLGSTLLHMIPRTQLLGALLLTAYLGGATATQVRMGGPLFPVFFPVLVGALLWGAYALRSPALRSLLRHQAR